MFHAILLVSHWLGTHLQGTVLICILKPDASQGCLPIYQSELYILFCTSPCQDGTTHTSAYDGDLGVVFVDNAVPWLCCHDSNTCVI